MTRHVLAGRCALLPRPRRRGLLQYATVSPCRGSRAHVKPGHGEAVSRRERHLRRRNVPKFQLRPSRAGKGIGLPAHEFDRLPHRLLALGSKTGHDAHTEHRTRGQYTEPMPSRRSRLSEFVATRVAVTVTRERVASTHNRNPERRVSRLQLILLRDSGGASDSWCGGAARKVIHRRDVAKSLPRIHQPHREEPRLPAAPRRDRSAPQRSRPPSRSPGRYVSGTNISRRCRRHSAAAFINLT